MELERLNWHKGWEGKVEKEIQGGIKIMKTFQKSCVEMYCYRSSQRWMDGWMDGGS